MANFEQLKATVANVIKTNGEENITGAIMQDVLLTIINSIAGGYMFGGVAQHSGNVGNPDYNVFYLAGSGAYTGYGGAITIPDGCYGVFLYDGTWSQEVVDIGVHLTGDVATGEQDGVTGGRIKQALDDLEDNINRAINELAYGIRQTFESLLVSDVTAAVDKLVKITEGIRITAGGQIVNISTFDILAATAEKAGLMSAADKQKLDAFIINIRSLRIQDTTAQEDQDTEITNTLKWTIGGVTEAITAFTLYAATTSKAGLMSAADKTALDTLPSLINAGYLYAGIATPSTVPSSTSAKIFYIAIEGGTYTSFGNLNVTQGINIIYKSDNAWSAAQVVGIDNEPTAGSDNLVKSGGVKTELALGAVYDVSAHNNGATFESLSALLSDTDLNALIPTAVRKGGMSIKFVQSSHNKYVQYRYELEYENTTSGNTAFLNTENWEENGSSVSVSDGSQSDLDISDENGNVLARFENGHFKVKNFDSADALDSIHAILSNIGFDNIPEFNEEEDYAIGDVVRYGKLVYIFTSAHEAGNWDASEVEENTVLLVDVTNSSSEADLDISDEHGNVLLRCANGHIRTKNFNSEDIEVDSPVEVENASSDADLDISDEQGNILVQFAGGHIKVKNFDSRDGIPSTVKIGGVDIQKHFIDLQGKKIMLYGDSISSSDYSFYKDALEEITNAEVYNGGFSGYTTAQLASATCLSRAINYNPDVVLILVGGNDMGNSGTIGTFGTYGGLLANETIVNIPSITSSYSGSKYIEAVAYIAQYLTYYIGGFRHNAYLDGDCTDVGSQLANESDLDNVTKPIVILCTTIPQQRYNSSSDWSSHANSKRKADACREVAQLLNIPLLDFAARAGFAEINEAYWQSPTDKVHNKGTYMMDGLHPNKFGYRRMARLVYDFLTPYFIK